ncbi:MAG: hypothetical protein JRF33_25285 [Deltaproteobacteria bacterium]|nr:hypothetical protein [Deltaproteobacteria bacterium]
MELQEPRYFTQHGSRVLVNPNRERTYVGQYAGQRYTFPPLQPMHVPEGVASLLVIKAEKHFAEAKDDAKNERAAFEHLIKLGGSSRIKALDFVDEEGKPRTQIWPLPPLVDITNDPDILNRMIPSQTEEAKIDLANRLHRDFMAKEKTDDAMASGAKATKEMAAPRQEWIKAKDGKNLLMDYIKVHGGRCGTAEHVSTLLEKCQELYNKEVELLASVGIMVVEPDPEAEE